MRELRQILSENNFRFEKKFGQNFITDTNLLRAIAADSGITPDCPVIEIGAGGGTLTRELCAAAKTVTAFEIDKSLKPILAETLSGFNNYSLHFSDIMEIPTEEIESLAGGPYRVVANLPYYITTPVIMKFLEEGKNLLSMTVMVQKEVAERLCAKPGGKDYGSVTVAVDFAGTAKITRFVNRNMFYPVPNVDSAIVRIDIDRAKFSVKDREVFYRLYRCAFAMRRKTLLNNIMSAFSLARERAESAITSCGFDPCVRGERLSAKDFALLSDKIYEMIKNSG